jgi:hypothetical protein
VFSSKTRLRVHRIFAFVREKTEKNTYFVLCMYLSKTTWKYKHSHRLRMYAENVPLFREQKEDHFLIRGNSNFCVSEHNELYNKFKTAQIIMMILYI